jgi:hypothetical protein
MKMIISFWNQKLLLQRKYSRSSRTLSQQPTGLLMWHVRAVLIMSPSSNQEKKMSLGHNKTDA